MQGFYEPHHVPSDAELRAMYEDFRAEREMEEDEWWERQDAAVVRRHIESIELTSVDGTE